MNKHDTFGNDIIRFFYYKHHSPIETEIARYLINTEAVY